MHQSPAEPMRSSVTGRLARAAVLGALAATLAGCLDDKTTKQMAQSESVLAPVFKSGPTPKEAAAWAADPYDADKRARGTLLLANAPFGGADAYLALYRDHRTAASTPVQAASARALGLHGAPEDVPRLLPLMNSPDKMVRLEATRSMQRLHNPVAIGPLITRVDEGKEQEVEIRAEAASALGQYAETKVLQALIGALGDQSLLVNINAYESLKTLTGQEDLPGERKAWTQWAKGNKTPFAGQKAYVYPVYWREKRWLDYLPFRGPVPNEIAASPVGFPDLGNKTASAGTAAGSGSADQSKKQ